MSSCLDLRFLQGAWPFGIVETIWSAVALRRWRLEKRRADNGSKKVEPGGGRPISPGRQGKVKDRSIADLAGYADFATV